MNNFSQQPRQVHRVLLWLALALSSLVPTGCSSVDFDYPKVPTYAYPDLNDTELGRLADNLDGGEPGESGFYMMADGIEALAARLIMARRAERSLDVQYYLISDDIAGFLMLRELLRAADRGVRVRLLVDDIQTQGYERAMWALDLHRNVEVRVFNPFGSRKWRMLTSLFELGRVNRRMHNKSLTADNHITVIGGRNIAAEYFAARSDVNFSDVDMLCIGPVVEEVSTMFDLYWNDRLAAPVPSFVKQPDDPAREQREFMQRLEQNLEGVEPGPYGLALNQTIVETATNRDHSDGELIWADYELVYDSPSKADVRREQDEVSIAVPLRRTLESAMQEVVIITPYFVPRDPGTELLVGLRKRGVRVIVVTNSLAANNHSVVHSGYIRSRKPLLEAGVELWEVSPEAQVEGTRKEGFAFPRATLHTKAFIVDGRRIFVGSFNFDPRSVYLNTEMGIIVESPEMAAVGLERVHRLLPTSSYEVVLNPEGKLRWVARQADGPDVIYDKEPETGFWLRRWVGFLSLLPIKSQL